MMNYGGQIMYKYMFIKANVQGFFTEANHREAIEKYSKEGWRFVTAIPISFGAHGQIKEFDLVFEKEEQINE